MSDQSNIEWTDSTFNPWEGCQKVGPGCDNCYAEARNARFAGGTAINWGAGAPRRRTSVANWRKPVQWNREPFWQCECGWRGADLDLDRAPESLSALTKDVPACQDCNRVDLKPARRRVFCASLADVFDNAVPAQWRIELFKLIEQTPNLDWLLLSKRIGNAAEMLEQAVRPINHGRWGWRDNVFPNVRIGATIVNQEEADRDIPKLLATPASIRFLSMEPLLGPVDLASIDVDGHHEVLPLGAGWLGRLEKGQSEGPRIDWVIVGGESGTNARPMHPQWARDLRGQCAAAGVPLLFKQWGSWAPTTMVGFGDSIKAKTHIFSIGKCVESYGGPIPFTEEMRLVGKKVAGRLLDGVEHNGYPEVRP